MRIDTGEYSPWLGDSYDNFARFGLSFQRSQNSGRLHAGAGGPSYGYYKRVGIARGRAPAKEQSFFDGIDTSYSGPVHDARPAARRRASPALAARSTRAVGRAMRRLQRAPIRRPSVPGAGRGAAAHPRGDRQERRRGPTRCSCCASRSGSSRTRSHRARPRADRDRAAGRRCPSRPARSPRSRRRRRWRRRFPARRFEVRARLTNRGRLAIAPAEIALETLTGLDARAPAGDTGIAPSVARPRGAGAALRRDASPPTRRSAPGRTSVAPGCRRAATTLDDAAAFGRPASAPPLVAVARYTVEGVAGRGARGGPPPRGEAALRRRDARAARRAARWR